MLRPVTPDDTLPLVALADGTGMFKPQEIKGLREVLDDYHLREHLQGHLCLAAEMEGRVEGFVYYAPAALAEGAWHLYWIAVARQYQGRGLGSVLLHRAEGDARERGGRILFVETSSLPHYDPTRRFYVKHAYQVAAVIEDFYADGDDMVIFRKRLK